MIQGSRTVLHGLHAACPKTQKKTSQQLCGPRRGTKNSLAATIWGRFGEKMFKIMHSNQGKKTKSSKIKPTKHGKIAKKIAYTSV